MTRYGDIKLEPDHIEPVLVRDDVFSWYGYWGNVLRRIRPVIHFLSPPPGEAGTVAAAREALKLTFFHWDCGWAMYAIVALILALILAYFGFRHYLPLTIRSALYPIFGDRIYGPLGNTVDIFAILSTVGREATTMSWDGPGNRSLMTFSNNTNDI